MPFKFTLLSDVAAFLKGTKSVEDALDEVAGSLDDLARDTESDADKAADALAGKFTSALDKVKAEAKSTGDSVGTHMKDGTGKATEATDNMKEAAHQNAREVAASFDGSAQSLVDGFQGAAAEMFDGFGPAGAAAGLAVAAGLGLASAALTQAQEDAKEAKEETLELGKSLATASSRAQGLADATADAMSEMTKNPQTIIDAMFGTDGVDRLTLYSEVIRQAGLNYSDVLSAMRGDDEAYARVTQQSWAASDAAHDQSTISFMTDLDKRRQAAQDGQRWADEYANSQVAAQQKAAEAQQHAAEVSQQWAESLADHVSVADEGLDQFVKGSDVSWEKWKKQLKEARKEGVLDVAAWAREVKERAREVKEIEDFSIKVLPKLSPDTQQAFAQLPTDTQTQIVEAYNKADKKGKRKITTTLEAEAKVTVNTKETQVDVGKVSIPAEVTGAEKAAQSAADAAQAEANKSSNVIQIKTRIDRDELQRQVNRAAASVTPPTVWVPVRPKKEVP